MGDGPARLLFVMAPLPQRASPELCAAPELVSVPKPCARPGLGCVLELRSDFAVLLAGLDWHAVDVKRMNATTEHPMVDWEPITYKDLIIVTEWMAQQGYSAARLAEAVREPAKYTEELRAVVRHNSDIAARQKEQDKAIQKQAAAEFMAARAAKHAVDTPELPRSRRAGPEQVARLLT